MKYRNFMIILYTEDKKHCSILDYIINNFNNYAYILHDKDYNENGEIKKPHYHVMLCFDNPRTITGLSKELDLLPNYIEPTKHNYIKGLRYLIHADEEDKYLYAVEEVKGTKTLIRKLENSLNADKTECEYIIEIIDIIDNQDYINKREFVLEMCRKNLYSYYRRSACIINDIIFEHNQRYRNF